MPIIESLAAAVLWALGTVLGRYLGRELEFQQILSLRFFFGLVASAIALADHGRRSAFAGAHDSLWIAYLAVVTGLLALGLYYFGLKRTPAVLASLAELTYPAIAVIAGIYAYNAHLRWTPVARRRDHHRASSPCCPCSGGGRWCAAGAGRARASASAGRRGLGSASRGSSRHAGGSRLPRRAARLARREPARGAARRPRRRAALRRRVRPRVEPACSTRPATRA